MITKEELVRGVARTQSDMDVAMRDPSLRNEVGAVEARYAALELLESFFRRPPANANSAPTAATATAISS